MPYNFTLSEMIQSDYVNDEFQAYIIYGPLGYGKSSYGLQVTAEVYGDPTAPSDSPDHWNWEMAKKRLFFHPKDFIKYLLSLQGRKKKVVIWDDAGLWLYALDWHSPFVKAVGKYMNVARTDLAAIIFTTPLPTWVFKKVRDFPQCRTIKIIKRAGRGDKLPYKYKGGPNRWGYKKGDIVPGRKPRRARIFQMWKSPDMKKSGVKETHQDDFDAYLPDDFFDWYEPVRSEYAETAKRMMNKELKGLVKETLGEDEAEKIDEEGLGADIDISKI